MSSTGKDPGHAANSPVEPWPPVPEPFRNPRRRDTDCVSCRDILVARLDRARPASAAARLLTLHDVTLHDESPRQLRRGLSFSAGC
jgi:hypothetical protein